MAVRDEEIVNQCEDDGTVYVDSETSFLDMISPKTEEERQAHRAAIDDLGSLVVAQRIEPYLDGEDVDYLELESELLEDEHDPEIIDLMIRAAKRGLPLEASYFDLGRAIHMPGMSHQNIFDMNVGEVIAIDRKQAASEQPEADPDGLWGGFAPEEGIIRTVYGAEIACAKSGDLTYIVDPHTKKAMVPGFETIEGVSNEGMVGTIGHKTYYVLPSEQSDAWRNYLQIEDTELMTYPLFLYASQLIVVRYNPDEGKSRNEITP